MLECYILPELLYVTVRQQLADELSSKRFLSTEPKGKQTKMAEVSSS